jgi:hypothetical protein
MADPKLITTPYNSGTPKGYMNIMKLFQTHVVEVKFKRREYPSRKGNGTGHRRNTRRMLCSSNWRFIASPIVKNVFDWKKPKGPAKGYQWYKQRNLLITWDILNQDWRMVTLDSWEVVAVMPVEKVLQKAEFLAFYHCAIEDMTRTHDPNGHRRNSFADK